jgi:large subunit ribosomal protein L2
MELGQMPVGTIMHNIEMKPGKGGQISRSAGTYAQLVGRDRGMVIVRLNSGEQRYIHADCMGTVGAVSNPDTGNQNLAKAGRNRWLGKRPLTRGVAKNPVDHPHGGGEGRTSGGRHPVTPWGKPTKGARTRHNKSTDKMIIRSRHAKKKR